MPSPQVTLRVLGPVTIEHRGDRGEVEGFRLSNRRAALLLVALAAEPGPHGADELIALLVDQNASVASDSIRNSLHRAVSDAKRALGTTKSLLTYNRGLRVYALERDPASLAIDLDQAAIHAAAGDWRMVVELHRGPVAQGLTELWLEDKRRAQRQSLATAVLELSPDLTHAECSGIVDSLLNGQPLPTDPSSDSPQHTHFEPLVYARDIHRAYELHGDAIIGRPARISGIITERTKTKSKIFLQVTDRTAATVQVLVTNATDETWQDALAMQVRDKIRAHGSLTVMYPRHSRGAVLTISADDFQVPSGAVANSTASAPPLAAVPHMGTYGARLANHFRDRLTQDGFVEVATKLISTDWPLDGVEVLKVVFEGYGSPFFLTPSPVQQLIDSIIESPFRRLFTVGRCITPTYRDPHVSSEAAVVAAVALDIHIRPMLAMVHKMALELHRSGETAPLRSIPAAAKVKTLLWPPASPVSGVAQPELQLFGPVSQGGSLDTSGGTLLGRLCWPFDHPEPQLRDYVLAEGYSQVAGDTSGLTTVVIHIERLLALLLDECEIRRIPMLAGSDEHSHLVDG